tara:strand:- start:561 stop:827 length:267 start_codon:yes stop_codon:yes gene_type:complete
MGTHIHTEDYQCENCNSTNSLREVVQDTKSDDYFVEMCFDCGYKRFLEEKTVHMSLEELNEEREFYGRNKITEDQLLKNQINVLCEID